MPWSGGSFTRTDGTRTGTTVWVQAKNASVKILAADHDTHDQDLADGINASLHKGGQNAATANISMGGFKLTNLANATSTGEAITYGQVGSLVQAYSANLGAIAALAVTDGNLIVGNGTTWVAESGATARASLGLTIGTDVQAYSSVLAAVAASSPMGDIAGLAVTDGNFIVGNGTTWVAESGATARTSLGLGTGNSPQFTAIELGAAADTTLGRVSAGVASIEGKQIAVLSTTTQSWTNGNTWTGSNINKFSTIGNGQRALDIEGTNATNGAALNFYWSPSGNGATGWAYMQYSYAKDSAGNTDNLGLHGGYVLDATSGSEDFEYTWQTAVAGAALANQFRISSGVIVGSPTGSYKGLGNVNIAGDYYRNNVPIFTDPAITGAITEDIYTISDGAAFEVDPGNGSVQLITLGANRTPKATNFANGESVTMMILDGTAYTLAWTDATWGGSGVVWAGGSAPTLDTTKYSVVSLWKVGGQVYGAYVGAC